jgi:hypothetical protein
MTMRSLLLMTVAGIGLAGCAGGPEGPPPSLTYGYVEGQQIAPPPDETPTITSGPMALGKNMPVDLALREVPPEKTWKSDSAKIADAKRKARRSALDCSFEGEIMTCPFQEGYRHKIYVDGASIERAQDSFETQFWLEPGEQTPEVIFGDPQWFKAELTGGGVDTTSMRAKRDKANGRQTTSARLNIVLKNYKPGVSTTMSINTGSRMYLYMLIVPSCKANEASPPAKCNAPYNSVVQHTYDSDQPQIKAAPAAQRSVSAQVANTRYEYQGSAEFLPGEWSAYNDGVKTYILPPPRLASRPVPMFPNGAPAQWWVDPSSNQYVIRGLPPEVVFSRGDAKMTVRKEQ